MKDLREQLAAKGVHTLIAQFTDIHGVARGKLVPLAHLDDLLTEGAAFSGPSITGSDLPRSGPRSAYWARGSASTARALPWMPGYARVVCDGFVANEPFEACPRLVGICAPRSNPNSFCSSASPANGYRPTTPTG